MDPDLLQEAVDRMRRVETRLTKFLVSIGFDTGVRQPIWNDGVIEVPSPACSLVDILSVVPDDVDADTLVDVTHRGRLLGSVIKP